MTGHGHEDVRYASAEDVLRALDMNPDGAAEHLVDRAAQRAEAATRAWITRTGRPFHAERVGDPDEARSWELHDAHDAGCGRRLPATVKLDQRRILPLDPTEDDALEVRLGRDRWRPVTDDEGGQWTLDYRSGRLKLYRRLWRRVWWDDPTDRILRITYRYGPLGEDVEIDEDGVVTSVPADVQGAVASKAAAQLALNDDSQTGIPDDGQLASRGSKREGLKEEWEETTAKYSSFSTV